MTDIVSEDPLAIGAPAVADIAVGVGVVELLVEDLVVTAGLEVVDVNTRAVTQVSHLRAVGKRRAWKDASLFFVSCVSLMSRE